MSDSANPFGPVIFSYSRAQALADGVLVDLTQIETIRTAFEYPVACTDTVWAIIEEALTHDGQDLEGIGHDISTMATHAIRRMRGGDRLFSRSSSQVGPTPSKCLSVPAIHLRRS